MDPRQPNPITVTDAAHRERLLTLFHMVWKANPEPGSDDARYLINVALAVDAYDRAHRDPKL